VTRGKAGFYSGRTFSSDPFFSDVTLLLHMDGAGNSFVDSSASPKTVSAFGDASQGGGPAAFGGAAGMNIASATGGSLSVEDSEDFNFGAGDFTVEGFLRIEALPPDLGIYGIIGQRLGSDTEQYSDSSFRLAIQRSGSNLYLIGNVFVGSSVTFFSQFVPYSTTSFIHYAMVRSGDRLLAYANGVQLGSHVTVNGSLNNSSRNIRIGADQFGSTVTNYFRGYIDEIRITKGVARYTEATYIVPNAPFPDSPPPPATDPFFSNVSLLLHMNGSGTSFTDSSASAKSVTAIGSATQVISPAMFKNTASMNIGTSSGGCLSIADSDDFAFGSGDFTVEAFIRPIAYPGNYVTCWVVAQSTYTNDSRNSFGLGLYNNNGTQSLVFSARESGGGFDTSAFTAFSASLTSFTHIAGVRSGGSLFLYANGSRIASASISGSLVNSTLPLVIGAVRNTPNTGFEAAYFFRGYIDDVRITKGVARYTGTTYTVPVSQFPDE